MNELGREYRVAAMGEIMMTRPISVYMEPDFLSVIKLIRDADVAVCEIEGLAFNNFQFARVEGTHMTPLSGEPWLAEEFKWMGFNLVALASNHATDYGVDGLLANMKVLDDIRLTYAGVGRDLWEARQPGYVETKKGRAAMVSFTSAMMHVSTAHWNSLHTAATESGNGLPGRAGVNPLRYDIVYTVTPELFEQLKKTNEQWGQSSRPIRVSPLHPKIEDEEISFLRCRVVAGDKPGIQYLPLKQDLEGNLRSIRNAKMNAGLVIASNHSHEIDLTLKKKWGATVERWSAPPKWERNFYKECIDAGADIFYGHGGHTGAGIEIYKGKPIFYGLGMPIDTKYSVQRYPLEEYEKLGIDRDATVSEYMYERWRRGGADPKANEWELKCVMAICTMQDGELTELKLYPTDATGGEIWLDGKSGLVNRGVRPLMAKGEEARKIVERYAKLSEPFGTEIEFKDGLGIVKV